MRVILFAIISCFFFSFCSDCVAQTQEFSIPEFVSLEDKWNSMIGKPLRIEGRYSAFSPTAMRFQKCNLKFSLPPNPVHPKGRSKNIEVNGTLKQEKNKLVFRVTRFRLLPNDEDYFLSKKKTLSNNDPVPWYTLGEKSLERGKFYEDRFLLKLGTDLLEEGIQIERQQHKPITPTFLSELAVKAAQLGLPERLQLSLIFESLHIQMLAALKSKKTDLSLLRKQIEKQLPGSSIPLTSLQGVIFDRFRKSPLSTFQNANDHARRQLSRLFYLQVLQEEYRRRLINDARNGDAVAEDYQKNAPDDPKTAQSFRQMALTYRLKNITSVRRNEVLEVAREYRSQNKPEMALTALKTWLDYRTSQLNKAGPSDYVATAIDYEQWFSDHNKSEEILLAGIERFPDDKELRSQLTKRDYIESKNQWVARSSLPKTMPNKIQQAMKTGRIVKGMSREQVANSLGAPKTVSRIASARQTVLIWNYPDAHLAVRFTQRPEKTGYVVAAVNSLPAR